jgi:hypothetical protein
MNTNSGMCAWSRPKGPPEQLDEKAERDQPDAAAKREHQPRRYFCEKQRNDRPDQRRLAEAERIIDQQVDVGNAGLALDLVEKNPIRTATLTASINRQGYS